MLVIGLKINPCEYRCRYEVSRAVWNPRNDPPEVMQPCPRRNEAPLSREPHGMCLISL
jgi:hypothetical protein